MDKQLAKAVEALAVKAAGATNAIEAQQFAQAALNAANALVTLRLNLKH